MTSSPPVSSVVFTSSPLVSSVVFTSSPPVSSVVLYKMFTTLFDQLTHFAHDAVSTFFIETPVSLNHGDFLFGGETYSRIGLL